MPLVITFYVEKNPCGFVTYLLKCRSWRAHVLLLLFVFHNVGFIEVSGTMIVNSPFYSNKMKKCS